jgi:hypothetical protein
MQEWGHGALAAHFGIFVIPGRTDRSVQGKIPLAHAGCYEAIIRRSHECERVEVCAGIGSPRAPAALFPRRPTRCSLLQQSELRHLGQRATIQMPACSAESFFGFHPFD